MRRVLMVEREWRIVKEREEGDFMKRCEVTIE